MPVNEWDIRRSMMSSADYVASAVKAADATFRESGEAARDQSFDSHARLKEKTCPEIDG